ncbi:MGDG synthase family glycosyltransferase [Nocardioides anomalus]|uniref:MGDG synthase family glycosyltransferase n=1 Tax=Nocardioides anomalus TaxID=2712223 RepID=UPI001E44AB79|nr:glycosyltransferase [Nocardioides anomalus]
MNTGGVFVVSGSYGAGHDAAADALTQRLRSAGHRVRRLDVAEELPWRIGALLRWLYFIQLRLLPGSWGSTLRFLQRDGWPLRLVRCLLGLLGRGLAAQVADATLVVSTHPFASQALGEARARGALDVPVVTYLTDASVHRLWVHGAVDLHLAIHELTAGQARALGGRTAVVRPVVAAVGVPSPLDWLAPWPVDRPAALVVGGSCGVGDLHQTAEDLLATGLVTPVVACGSNDRLRAQLRDVPGIVALGWRDDMAALVAAASCVVQNAGGMTSLEALAAGTPTITYRPIPGHGTTNAEVLHRAGLVPWASDPADLPGVVARALLRSAPSGLPAGAPDVLETLERHALVAPTPALVAA